jgi:hypothetical protein
LKASLMLYLNIWIPGADSKLLVRLVPDLMRQDGKRFE